MPSHTGHIWSAPYEVEIPEMGTTPTQVNVTSLTINGATMMVMRSDGEPDDVEPVARALANHFQLQVLIVSDEGIGTLNDEAMRAIGWVRA